MEFPEISKHVKRKSIPPMIRSALFLIMVMVAIPPAAVSQDIETELGKRKADETMMIGLPALEAAKVLLEERVDPATYTLGPGDILSIFTWGNFQGQYRLPVSPEGVLLVPEIGPIEVSGITLEKAEKKISTSILRRYRNVETVVSLVDLRTFKVYVGGAVNLPGAYPATAVTRVSEVINAAGGFLGEVDPEINFPPDIRSMASDKKMASKRNVLVYRKNGDSLKADILRFEITGQTKFDPRLRDGDRIFVPVQESSINLYGIFGAVKNPGYFEYSQHDSLADLIELAHGLKLDADSQNVEIVRFKPDNRQTYSIMVGLKSADWNVPLSADDRVYVKAIQEYHQKYQVLLTGEFEYPGYYAIKRDSTLLTEVVGKAGGFTPMASLEEAEMTRVSIEEIIDPEFERLKNMQVSDMTESEYDYYKTKSRSKPGRVAIDFVGLFVNGDSTKDFILRDGDVIGIPRKSKVVSVIGEVSNPGLLPHESGADYRYYIRRAGGFSDRANKGKISVIKGISREWMKAKKGKALEPGDTVWIPEKKKHDYWIFIKETLAFVGNLATVYLVIQQATK
jgi:protein involved in polysaccharide export with SLBB domain